MAQLITITIAAGAHLGPESDTPILLNSDKIIRVEDSASDDLGNSVISLDDGSKLFVTETQATLQSLVNGE